jgi:hypothetical protein
MPNAVAGTLHIPPNTPDTTTQQIRSAHLFKPLSVLLREPISYNSATSTFQCAEILLLDS